MAFHSYLIRNTDRKHRQLYTAMLTEVYAEKNE